MSTAGYGRVTERITDQVIAGLKRVEGVVTSSTERVAGLAAKGPDLPKLPLTGKLPTPREVATANVAVLTRLLDAQKQYAQHLLEATGSGSAEPQRNGSAPTGSTSRPRTTARKAATKTATKTARKTTKPSA